uniref:tyrosine-protein kinase Fyn-like n=1 Tax=Styela clava TaxID=7725 RepID=UPI0019393C26|nr:tyrosine-protein kinase Fyn-like [Styela clava]
MFFLFSIVEKGDEVWVPSNENQIYKDTKVSETLFAELWKGKFGSQKVIIKIWKPDAKLFGNSFMNEFNTIKKLSHKNIMTLYGAVTDKKILLLEYMKYGNLLDFLKTGEGRHSTIKDQIGMATQIASGMAYLEQKQYIFINLRAESVSFGENLSCKLFDFSMARYVGDDGKWRPYGMCTCPIKWTAPEIFFYGVYSNKSDVWSFGVLLTELVTKGRMPYPGMSNKEVRNKYNEGYRMPRPASCPERLYEVMLKCWDEDPEKRPEFEYLEDFLKNNEFDNESEHIDNNDVGSISVETTGSPDAQKATPATKKKAQALFDFDESES